MRIIYFSHTFFSDCDFPLISELEKQGHDVFAYYHLSSWELNAGLVEISHQPSRDGIIPASEYKEMRVYKDFVNLDHIFFINNPHSRRFHLQKRLVWLKMFRHMKKCHADVVQITWQLQGWETLLFKLGIPVVMTVHDPFQHSSRFTKKTEELRINSFSRSQKLILLNHEMKSAFERHYKIPAYKIAVSKLGEYSHIRLFKADICKFTEKPFVLFFGFISRYKGIKYLVEAMDSLHDAYPNIGLVIIGRGNIDFDLSQYEKRGYLKFINRFATSEELATLLQQCMFAVCPYTDATQSGVVQTAFSAGCPLIVTNVGNLPKAVTDNVNGLVVNPSDSADLARAMESLFKNPNRLVDFRHNIEDSWQKSMSWEPIAQDYIQVYNDALKERKC